MFFPLCFWSLPLPVPLSVYLEVVSGPPPARPDLRHRPVPGIDSVYYSQRRHAPHGSLLCTWAVGEVWATLRPVY